MYIFGELEMLGSDDHTCPAFLTTVLVHGCSVTLKVTVQSKISNLSIIRHHSDATSLATVT